MRSYAASRISMWRKRNASSIASCGWISSLRTSAASVAPPGRRRSGESSRERLPLELEPNDGRALEQLAFLVGKRVEPRGEERLDRRGHVLGIALLCEHREQLLDEERVPLGHRSDDDARAPSSSVSRPSELLDQLRRTRLAESGSSVIVSAGRPPHPGRTIEQLRPGEAEEQERSVSRPVRQVLERSRSVGSAQ